jgi:hypothetical protein
MGASDERIGIGGVRAGGSGGGRSGGSGRRCGSFGGWGSLTTYARE